MSIEKRTHPPLLSLPHQDDYRYWFTWLYLSPSERAYYALNSNGKTRGTVRFRASDYNHAVTEGPLAGRKWAAGRAERLFWIGVALEEPTEVRRGKTPTRLYFLLHTDDERFPWYVVVTEEDAAGTHDFVTAYPLTEREAQSHRHARDHPLVYRRTEDRPASSGRSS